MHRYVNDSSESRDTLAGGRHGMILGAVAGALVFAVFSLIFDLWFEINTGGPGLNVMAGAAVGGLAGMMIGALRARHGGYRGPERRLHAIPIEGRDRRLHR